MLMSGFEPQTSSTYQKQPHYQPLPNLFSSNFAQKKIFFVIAIVLQQEQDIEQLNHAIAELERVTQQNAALVEQASAATLSLESQATQMTQAIALFKTTAHA